jgi:hypothetical protein
MTDDPAMRGRSCCASSACGWAHVDSLEDGVSATHRLVTHRALAATTGRFFDRTRDTKAHPQAYDTGGDHDG